MIRMNDLFRNAPVRFSLSGWIPGVLAALLIVTTASAQKTAMDYMRPHLDQRHYVELCRQLGIDREQREIIELLYRDYLANIESFVFEVDFAAISAGRPRIERVFAGHLRMKSEELKILRADVLSTYVGCGPKADELLEAFFNGLEGVLQEEQKGLLPGALRDLRRKITLHPRQIGNRTFSYAGDGFDLVEQVESARAASGELSQMDADRLDELLEPFKLELDAALRQYTPAYRDHQLGLSIARLGESTEVVQSHNRAILDAWNVIYQLNHTTAVQIGEAARDATGEWAQRLWLDRFDRGYFTWLYNPRQVDRQVEWVRNNDVPMDTLREAEMKYSLYLGERDLLQKEVISILVKARLERGVILHQLSSPADVEKTAGDLYKDLLRNSGAMENLDSRYGGEIEAMLDEEQRREMRRALQLRRRN